MRAKYALLLLGLGVLLLAGCGPNIIASKAGPPTSTTINPSSPTISASTRTAGTGIVTLHTNASFYKTSDTISVTVSNQSNQTIYFPDHLTNCSVILLQRQKAQPLVSGNGQGGINPCTLGIATRTHTLGPGQRLVVQLAAPFNGWLTGFYRAMLSYSASLNADPSKTLASPAFTVGPLEPQP